MSVTFTIPGKPQPKQRARKGKGGKWYTPRATKSFEQAVGLAAVCARCPVFDGPVHLTVVAYMPDKRRRDVDNVGKSVADGLNGVAYEDDTQVVQMTTRKELDRDYPRTVVTVEGVE